MLENCGGRRERKMTETHTNSGANDRWTGGGVPVVLAAPKCHGIKAGKRGEERGQREQPFP